MTRLDRIFIVRSVVCKLQSISCVDSTPLDWSEFTPLPGGSLIAKPDTAAAGKYDLFTALLHELGHISGFGHGDTTFDSKAVALNSDNNHIDSALYPHDLMASGLEVGERRLPSELDITLAAAPIIGAHTGIDTLT